VKLPRVPLPEPLLYEITVTHPSPRIRRAGVTALRFLLWVTPAVAVDCFLATADGGHHSLWLTLAAALAALAVAVLTVGVREGDGEGRK
jgi:hypothetical protein